MTASAHPPSGLSKATWTDADFPVMGRHDCRIHAVGVTEYEDDVHRLASPDDQPEPLWHIEGQNFDVRLRAHGYRQYLRMPPQAVPRQALTLAQRNGIGFAEQPFA